MILLSYATVDFYLFYNGAVDLQICTLLTRSKVSDTQVTLRPVDLLFFLPTNYLFAINGYKLKFLVNEIVVDNF